MGEPIYNVILRGGGAGKKEARIRVKFKLGVFLRLVRDQALVFRNRGKKLKLTNFPVSIFTLSSRPDLNESLLIDKTAPLFGRTRSHVTI
jgi:hypothetical protein